MVKLTLHLLELSFINTERKTTYLDNIKTERV